MGGAKEGCVVTCHNSLKPTRSSDNHIHPLDRLELIFCGKRGIKVCFYWRDREKDVNAGSGGGEEERKETDKQAQGILDSQKSAVY